MKTVRELEVDYRLERLEDIALFLWSDLMDGYAATGINEAAKRLAEIFPEPLEKKAKARR